jgi:hypothetical protein
LPSAFAGLVASGVVPGFSPVGFPSDFESGEPAGFFDCSPPCPSFCSPGCEPSFGAFGLDSPGFGSLPCDGLLSPGLG